MGSPWFDHVGPYIFCALVRPGSPWCWFAWFALVYMRAAVRLVKNHRVKNSYGKKSPGKK